MLFDQGKGANHRNLRHSWCERSPICNRLGNSKSDATKDSNRQRENHGGRSRRNNSDSEKIKNGKAWRCGTRAYGMGITNYKQERRCYWRALDNNQEFQLNLFKALRLLKIAWNRVKQTTIQHCFRHAEFVDNDRGLSEEADEDEQEIEEIIGLWQQLVFRDRTNGAELDEYMYFDGDEMELSEAEEMKPIAVGPSEMTRRKPATILKKMPINRHNK